MTDRSEWTDANWNDDPLYVCAVLGCGRIAPTTYIAAEDGELAGWTWHRGDELHFCRCHAHDLYNDRDPLWEHGGGWRVDLPAP